MAAPSARSRRRRRSQTPVWLYPVVLLLLGGLIALGLSAVELSDGGSRAESRVAGSLSAGGARVLPGASGTVRQYAGQPARGQQLRVLSVNSNEGFFVGRNARDRVYVEWGGDVGENEPSTFQPRPGQRVNLTGPVQPIGSLQDLAVLKLRGADATSVGNQGAFVNADTVTPARD